MSLRGWRPSVAVAACALLTPLGASGCSSGSDGGPVATSAVAPPPSADIPTAASTPTTSSAPRSKASLPSPDAPPAEREAAALRVLRGEAEAKGLPIEATDNGFPLDPTLRDKIAPRARPPQVKMGATRVNGKLPPEVIQRIVRQNFGRFRLCYEEALKNDPALEGKVEVHFTIKADGSVANAKESGSTIQDATMKSCVTRAFDKLSFPSPEGGVVDVVYPINFSPPIE